MLGAPDPSIPWLIGVARHKLADHWRRVEREQRGLRLLDGEPARVDDPWGTVVDRIRASQSTNIHGVFLLILRRLYGIGSRIGARSSADPVDLGAPSELIGAAEPMSIEAVLADRIARLGERC
jgi:hypothetical protein